MDQSSVAAPLVPLARRVFHLVAVTSATLLVFVLPEHAYMLLLGSSALLGLVVDCIRHRLNVLNRLYLGILSPILKQSETTEITGATWFMIAAFFTFYFFGPEVAVPVLIFVAVGDPAAALVGVHFPGRRLWNKSPAGTVAFVAASLGVWAILSAFSLGAWSWPVVIAAVVAAAVELAPLPADDNLTVPLIAGAVMTLANALL